ncbi:MAG: RT0821/Lpp0805 family surface protein [Methylocystis sp.]|jgi:surface antigen
MSLAACALGACSVAMPASESWRANSDDITGSIHKAPPELARGLEAEDQRRATAALGTALDPQGAGGSVNWDNAQTGAKGSFTPVGPAYPIDGKICRAFVADVTTKEALERLQGAACREKSAEWSFTEVKPWRKG